MKKCIGIFLILLALTSCFEVTAAVEEAMRETISTLGQNNSFAFVDLGLTSEEIALIDRLKFGKILDGARTSYDRFGNLSLLNDELPTFLRDIGNDDEEVIQAVAEVISRTVYNVTRASNRDSAWVSVRAAPPNHAFDIPRWHMDGSYYGPRPYPGLVFKFAAVLKGNSTLLYPLPNEVRDIFISHSNDRAFLNELLDVNKAQSPKRGEGVFFIVADDTKSAVHSEPKMVENRLFFSILIGSEEEIQELNLKQRARNDIANEAPAVARICE